MGRNGGAAARTGEVSGAWSLVLGAVALIGVLMIGQASFGWIPGFDPADWLRVVTGWMMPVGAFGALIFGVRSRVRRAAPKLGAIGIAVAALSMGIFAVMILTHPY